MSTPDITVSPMVIPQSSATGLGVKPAAQLSTDEFATKNETDQFVSLTQDSTHTALITPYEFPTGSQPSDTALVALQTAALKVKLEKDAKGDDTAVETREELFKRDLAHMELLESPADKQEFAEHVANERKADPEYSKYSNELLTRANISVMSQKSGSPPTTNLESLLNEKDPKKKDANQKAIKDMVNHNGGVKVFNWHLANEAASDEQKVVQISSNGDGTYSAYQITKKQAESLKYADLRVAMQNDVARDEIFEFADGADNTEVRSALKTLAENEVKEQKAFLEEAIGDFNKEIEDTQSSIENDEKSLPAIQESIETHTKAIAEAEAEIKTAKEERITAIKDEISNADAKNPKARADTIFDKNLGTWDRDKAGMIRKANYSPAEIKERVGQDIDLILGNNESAAEQHIALKAYFNKAKSKLSKDSERAALEATFNEKLSMKNSEGRVDYEPVIQDGKYKGYHNGFSRVQEVKEQETTINNQINKVAAATVQREDAEVQLEEKKAGIQLKKDYITAVEKNKAQFKAELENVERVETELNQTDVTDQEGWSSFKAKLTDIDTNVFARRYGTVQDKDHGKMSFYLREQNNHKAYAGGNVSPEKLLEMRHEAELEKAYRVRKNYLVTDDQFDSKGYFIGDPQRLVPKEDNQDYVGKAGKKALANKFQAMSIRHAEDGVVSPEEMRELEDAIAGKPYGTNPGEHLSLGQQHIALAAYLDDKGGVKDVADITRKNSEAFGLVNKSYKKMGYALGDGTGRINHKIPIFGDGGVNPNFSNMISDGNGVPAAAKKQRDPQAMAQAAQAWQSIFAALNQSTNDIFNTINNMSGYGNYSGLYAARQNLYAHYAARRESIFAERRQSSGYHRTA